MKRRDKDGSMLQELFCSNDDSQYGGESFKYETDVAATDSEFEFIQISAN